MRADVHMHSNFSHDSESSPEEMIKGAIEKGLEMICFTDHYDKDNFFWGPEDIFEPEVYFQTLEALRDKYRGKIDVRIGVEIGLQPHLIPYYEEFIPQYPFDFVIGSAHSIRKTDLAYGLTYQTEFTGMTDEEIYRETLEETLEDVRGQENFDVLGHLDYVVRYGKNRERDYSYKKYADLIDEILRTLIAKGKGLELNMAGLKYGLPFAHPHPDVLKRYRELGGEIITVGADGHKPEHIAYDFSRAAGILKNCGFDHYTEYSKRRPVFRKLP